MRKVLFLDIDGVLNTKHWDRNASIDQYGYVFDPIAVTNLGKIVEESCADIVISSSWKGMGFAKLCEMWKNRKLPGKIVGITPDIMDESVVNIEFDNNELMCSRGCEIKAWLIQQRGDVTNYAILDDVDDVLPEQQSHFVWIDPDTGITKDNSVQAIMILKRVEHEKNIQ